MNSNHHRRAVLKGLLAAPVLAAGGSLLSPATAAAKPRSHSLTAIVRQLEQDYSARVGLTVLDPRTGRRFDHRGGERFAMCSPFKVYAAAAVLLKYGPNPTNEVYVDPDDLVEYSPMTEAAQGTTVPLSWLCQVALSHSDNTAGNYMLRALGGPAAITRFARSIGDRQTRLDRWEPELNSALRGDLRDTSTPASLAYGHRKIILGELLRRPARDQLTGWMLGTTTSDEVIRAGLPDGWTSADKTGGGAFATRNDVGVVWDADGRSLVLAILTDTTTGDPEAKSSNKLLADVTRAVVAARW